MELARKLKEQRKKKNNSGDKRASDTTTGSDFKQGDRSMCTQHMNMLKVCRTTSTHSIYQKPALNYVIVGDTLYPLVFRYTAFCFQILGWLAQWPVCACVVQFNTTKIIHIKCQRL